MRKKVLFFLLGLAVSGTTWASDTNLGPVSAVERSTKILDSDLDTCAKDFGSHGETQVMSCTIGATINSSELMVNADKQVVTFYGLGAGIDSDMVVTFQAEGSGYTIYVKLPYSMMNNQSKYIFPYVKEAMKHLESRELRSLIYTHQ